jgi:O-antigen/teichoic acid export membrane protein
MTPRIGVRSAIERARATWQSIRQDRLLRNTGYLAGSNTFGTALSMVQSIVAAWLLGVQGVGELGIIIAFTSTINRLFSFRMGELVVSYLGPDLAEGRKDRAAALVKAAALTEAVTSLLAFGLLIVLAPWGADTFSKNPALAPLFLLYGLTIPGNLMTETSTGVLQVWRRYRSQAWVNLSQAVLTMLLIVAAYFAQAGLWAVVAAYLLGKMILGIGPMVLAWQALREHLGPGWWRASFRLLPPFKEWTSFAVSTNLSATLTLIVRDNEILWISYFLSAYDSGLYKVALAIINLVMVPITPFISTTYPEISRSIAEKNWRQLLRLLRRVTLIAGGFTGVVGIGLVLFGNFLLLIYGKGQPDFVAAYPAMLALLVGFGFANTLFWNRSLLLAFKLPGYPFRVMLGCGLVKMLLAFWVVPAFGILGEAVLLSAYFVVSVGLITLRGLRQIPKMEEI